ncbi:11530_t:CDS:2 [Funneliformis caledonium]|uniref:11530_t:CDS:1 n=1 Tax=Funneliformis caledonium TaxID=1117310 RepID=A0A9N9DZM3_9GLOM|nr:11530_t:CDS:2 [Funneliformis caledonium]
MSDNEERRIQWSSSAPNWKCATRLEGQCKNSSYKAYGGGKVICNGVP